MEELYHQITLDEWVNMKEELAKDFLGVSQSFVRIGYKLRQIKEQELFRNDGCDSLTEWGKKEFGLSASTISRFIQINEKYSIGGNSDQLLPEFAKYGSSKLTEMLALPAEDLQMVRPEMSREGIRELKDFNKAEPKEENDLTDLVKGFWNQLAKKSLLTELDFDADLEDLVDQINPSGNQTYRKGLYIMMMYEDEIKVKKVGGSPETMSWERFIEISKEIVKSQPTEEQKPAAEVKADESVKELVAEPEAAGEEKPVAPAQMPDLTDKTQDLKEPEIAEDFMPEPEQIEQETVQNEHETDQIDTEITEETPDETETETENEAAAAVEAEIIEEKEAESAESTENTDQSVSLGGITDMIMDLRRAVWSQMWDDALEITEKISKAIREVQECL